MAKPQEGKSKRGWWTRLFGKAGEVEQGVEPRRPVAVVVADLFEEGHSVVARLRALGLETVLSIGGEDAMARVQSQAPALLYLDCWEARMDGVALLQIASHYHPDLPARTVACIPGGAASEKGTALVTLGVRTIAPRRLDIAALGEAVEQAIDQAIDPERMAEAVRLFPPEAEAGEEGDLQPGEEVGERFIVVGIAGRGSSSTVYEVRDGHQPDEAESLGYALKLLLPGAPGEDPAGALLREYEVTAAVDHPNVVRGYHQGAHEGTPFITMDLVRGDSLEDWLERQETLPAVAETFRLLAGGARGLEAMHAGGLVHRDVKPGNLLVDERTGLLKLIDFGATLLPDAPEHTNPTGSIVGTPTYVSPEQLLGRTDGTVRSDIFSLGVVLYEALTGRRPFRGGTVNQLLRRIAEETPVAPTKLNPAIPSSLSDTILKMLSKRPELRPVNVAEVLEALADGRPPPKVSSEGAEGPADNQAALSALLDFDDSFADEASEGLDSGGPEGVLAARDPEGP